MSASFRIVSRWIQITILHPQCDSRTPFIMTTYICRVRLSCMLSLLIPGRWKIPRCKEGICYYFHFTDKEIDAHKNLKICLEFRSLQARSHLSMLPWYFRENNKQLTFLWCFTFHTGLAVVQIRIKLMTSWRPLC